MQSLHTVYYGKQHLYYLSDKFLYYSIQLKIIIAVAMHFFKLFRCINFKALV